MLKINPVHKCNYYCEPEHDLHTCIVVSNPEKTLAQVEASQRRKYKSDFISIKRATEITVEEAIKQVIIPDWFNRALLTKDCLITLVTIRGELNNAHP